VAETVAWLLSPRAAYVDCATITVDGGLVMP
jgi:NAD(P)-dependent dehydrogenase (short-subunit alcohol dehydrogenase family)